MELVQIYVVFEQLVNQAALGVYCLVLLDHQFSQQAVGKNEEHDQQGKCSQLAFVLPSEVFGEVHLEAPVARAI